jgi:restriction system protein
MALPKHTELMRPVLELHRDGEPHRGPELEDALVSRLGIDAADRAQENKGGVRTLVNRIAWAQVDLSQAGLLSRPERGVTQITDRGREVLSSPPDVIDRKYLQRFPEFRDWLNRSRNKPDPNDFVDGQRVTREAVLQALEEAQRMGRDEFRMKYGYGRAVSWPRGAR